MLVPLENPNQKEKSMFDRLVNTYQKLAKFVLYEMPAALQLFMALVSFTSLIFAPLLWNLAMVIVFSYIAVNLPEKTETEEK